MIYFHFFKPFQEDFDFSDETFWEHSKIRERF
jgi:hypothetical protein